jgi:hypothetical protein
MNWYETYDYEVTIRYETWKYTTSTGTTYTYDTHVLFKTGEYLESATESVEGGLSI